MYILIFLVSYIKDNLHFGFFFHFTTCKKSLHPFVKLFLILFHNFLAPHHLNVLELILDGMKRGHPKAALF